VRLWRISNYADLTGVGGLISSARWNSRGAHIVYLAESPAAALLERLVHLEIDTDDIPSSYQLLVVEIADHLSFDTIDANDLPRNWRSNDTVTRPAGDRWLQSGRTALLRVPSAITPHTWNWLLNPRHPDAMNAKIVDVMSVPFDARLFR
jgi:RES domain-containing protein